MSKQNIYLGPRPRSSLSRKVLVASLIFILLLILVGGSTLAWLYWWGYQAYELPEKTPVIVELNRGMSLRRFADTLQERGVVKHSLVFVSYVRLFSHYHKFQAGTYRFGPVVTPHQMVNDFITGKIYEPVILSITIPEGFTYAKIAARLVAHGIGHPEFYKNVFKNKSFLEKYRIPSSTLEGYLYPTTYRYKKKPKPESVLSHMIRMFWSQLPQDYEMRANEMGISLNEAVTFASLIELETRLDEERPIVAEVIWRRLRQGVPLAIDAALIYGIKDYQGDIKWKHLRDRNNPYNTRIHKGLPPTPICSPAIKSLLAVLNPTNYGYNYYVRDLSDPNRHHFSKTLAEHNRYVQKLRRLEKRR